MSSTLPLNASSLQAFVRSRQTTHDFHGESVPEESLRRALECAIRAPNHHLTNPWRFTLLGHQTRAAIASANAKLVAAKRGEESGQIKYTRWMAVPGWMVVTSLRDPNPVREEENFAASCCAVQNFALGLYAEDLGCKWTSGAVTQLPEFPELVGYDPATERFVGLLWFGYPKQHLPPTAREPVESVLRRRP
ncbi:MAG: nitroreductase family protein [Oceanococcaceae bacterium]